MTSTKRRSPLCRNATVPGALGEDRVVAAEAGARAGAEPRPALADEDHALLDLLAGEDLHAEHLRVRVAAVPRRTESLLVRHYSAPSSGSAFGFGAALASAPPSRPASASPGLRLGRCLRLRASSRPASSPRPPRPALPAHSAPPRCPAPIAVISICESWAAVPGVAPVARALPCTCRSGSSRRECCRRPSPSPACPSARTRPPRRRRRRGPRDGRSCPRPAQVGPRAVAAPPGRGTACRRAR